MSSFSVAVRATTTAAAAAATNNNNNNSKRLRQSNVAVAGGLPCSGRRRSGTGDVVRCRAARGGSGGGERGESSTSREMGGGGCSGAQHEEASSSTTTSFSFSDHQHHHFFDDIIQKNKSKVIGALSAALVAGTVAGGVGVGVASAAIPQPPSVGQIKTTIDAELIKREEEKDVEELQRLPITLEAFIAKEPPVLVGFLLFFIVNASVGLTWALFFRETSAGPGGEVGKGVVALRKEIVKGILKFFGSIMGSYVSRQDSRSR